MVADKSTAEEQLLKLIEGPPPEGAPPASASAAPTARGRLASWWAAWRRRGAADRRVGRIDPLLHRLSLSNRFLSVALGILMLYLIADLAWPRQARHRRAGFSGGEHASVGDETPAKPEEYLKPMSVYIRSASQRDVFAENPPVVAARQGPRPVEERIKAMAEGLVVVGIDRGANPQALIEDTQRQRTYFVRIGDDVSGMTVREIRHDGVMLTYEGLEVELAY